MTQSEINQKLTSLINQKIDYDKVYGHQCVDLVYYVLREIYGMQNWLNLPNGAAKDMANPSAYQEFANQLEFMINTPSFIPQAGDICVTKGGQYNPLFGHVFIILEGSNTVVMNTLEQNTGNGDGTGDDDRIVQRQRNYKDILTFVRWKGIKDSNNINVNNNIMNNEQIIEMMNEIVAGYKLTKDELERHAVIGRPSGLLYVDNDQRRALGEFFDRLTWVLDDRKREQVKELEEQNLDLKMEIAERNSKLLQDEFNRAEIDTVNPVESEGVEQAKNEAQTYLYTGNTQFNTSIKPTINEDEVKDLIIDTANQFKLNDWAMGWIKFGIDKWAVISSLLASAVYYLQNNVDEQYHAIILYTAIAWSTLILLSFLINKIIGKIK